MAFSLNDGCIKLRLPDGKVVDILTPVLRKMASYIQTDDKPESGGYIVGYEHETSHSIVLEDISTPYSLDTQSQIHFNMVDPRHRLFLMKAKLHKSFYMGVWHTHPQEVPSPSPIDWEDWKKTMEMDKTACDYIFFIIAGIQKTRVWVGDVKQGNIVELQECHKDKGLYIT